MFATISWWNKVLILGSETPDFIPPALWPPNSPDLNPVDYTVWSVRACIFSETRCRMPSYVIIKELCTSKHGPVFLAHPVYLSYAKCYSYMRQIKRVNFLEFDNAIDSVLCLVLLRCRWLRWLSRRMLSCVWSKGHKRRRSSCLTGRRPVCQHYMSVVVLFALHPCPASLDRLSLDRGPPRADTRRSSSNLKYETVVTTYTIVMLHTRRKRKKRKIWVRPWIM